MVEGRNEKLVCLFDVDGTLTKPRNKVEPSMIETLKKLKEKCVIAIVGGSDYAKQIEQLGEDGVALFDWVFSENGTYTLKGGKFYQKRAIKDELGEDRLKKFINFALHYIADLDIPVKRGTFIEYRNGLINVSPIGRNCSQEERDQYEKYDKENKIRENFIAALKQNFPDYNLKYSIGGQISFDVFPIGWDKTFCLRFLEDFETIHFFGDKTFEGGNDYEIYEHERTQGHSVKTFEDTIRIVNELFNPQ